MSYGPIITLRLIWIHSIERFNFQQAYKENVRVGINFCDNDFRKALLFIVWMPKNVWQQINIKTNESSLLQHLEIHCNMWIECELYFSGYLVKPDPKILMLFCCLGPFYDPSSYSWTVEEQQQQAIDLQCAMAVANNNCRWRRQEQEVRQGWILAKASEKGKEGLSNFHNGNCNTDRHPGTECHTSHPSWCYKLFNTEMVLWCDWIYFLSS